MIASALRGHGKNPVAVERECGGDQCIARPEKRSRVATTRLC